MKTVLYFLNHDTLICTKKSFMNLNAYNFHGNKNIINISNYNCILQINK